MLSYLSKYAKMDNFGFNGQIKEEENEDDTKKRISIKDLKEGK